MLSHLVQAPTHTGLPIEVCTLVSDCAAKGFGMQECRYRSPADFGRLLDVSSRGNVVLIGPCSGLETDDFFPAARSYLVWADHSTRG
jgi:hypothetical protein